MMLAAICCFIRSLVQSVDVVEAYFQLFSHGIPPVSGSFASVSEEVTTVSEYSFASFRRWSTFMESHWKPYGRRAPRLKR